MMNKVEERLVKSSKRVRDLGEVFTPMATVQEMLDLLPETVWKSHPSPAFLEPACGDGNFLVGIFDSKLGRINKGFANDKLAAGTGTEAAQFHALEALSSIYAVDISADNIIGGTIGHEIGARNRLLNMFTNWNLAVLSRHVEKNSAVFRAATWIVEHNLLVGNMLPYDANGKPTARERLPLIEYNWDPNTLTVTLRKTTFGDVMAIESAKITSQLSLFTPNEPVQFWHGNAFNISEATRVTAPKLRCPERNGKGLNR